MWPIDAAAPLVGIGGMRLSTERDRDEALAIRVLHAALDAGVTLVDTADAYCWNAGEAGHNERLVARALATWVPSGGERPRIHVATKGGLTRPNGEWVADGRGRHLREACEDSLRALDVKSIDLYQLHAPDPRTPLSTSVRALAALKREGLVEHVGLCNVTVGQIEEARRITDIAAVQVELSIWNDDNVLSGVVQHCISHGIRLIAYRPLGGSQRARKAASDADLVGLAARLGVSPFDVALAWLTDLSDTIVPIPGPTRIETAAALARPSAIRLTDGDRALLDRRFPASRIRQRSRPSPCAHDSRPAQQGEVVMIMGLPGAGKSTAARAFADRGFARLNRDEGGGSLRGLLPALAGLVESGESRIVLDNTYVTRKSRAAVVHAAAQHGLAVRCLWLSTSVEEAQVNAVSRIVSTYGRLLSPEEMRRAVKRDVSAFGPSVQFRHQRELEPPDPSEGFSAVEVVPFERTRNAAFTNRALIVWCDADMPAERGAVLRRYAEDGWPILGLGWQPGIADGLVTEPQADAEYARLQERLGVAIDILYCPHGGGPPVCWCRKPLPGLGVVFIERYRLDPAQSIYVGPGAQDPGFARRLGFQYRDAASFFACP